MKREEKRKKFHESLLNMLYSPQEQDNQTPVNISTDSLHSAHIPDDDEFDEEEEEEEKRCSSSNDGNQKLTRAQRKRLRKKKLKEAASQRRPIIGPLLPTDAPTVEPPGVRHNAAEEPVTEANQCGEDNWSKLKQRRMAKNQIRDKRENNRVSS